MQLKYFTAGAKEDIDCNLILKSEKGVIKLVFQCEKFKFVIVLNDIVDMEDFTNLLTNKEKKIILYCTLEKGKKYKGLRKLVNKGSNIAVSQGGARLVFGEECINQLLDIVFALKNKTL